MYLPLYFVIRVFPEEKEGFDRSEIRFTSVPSHGGRLLQTIIKQPILLFKLILPNSVQK
jgi:hypothetical protein